MPNRVVYFNGRFVPEAEARVSIFDSALMYGDMAFEMTRTYRQRPFKLGEHLERLYRSLRLLEIDCGLSPAEMERLTRETLEKNLPTESPDMDWQIMHDVSRGPLALYRTAFAEPLRPTVSINCWPRRQASRVGAAAGGRTASVAGWRRPRGSATIKALESGGEMSGNRVICHARRNCAG